ncbi:MAG: hypothetical protein JWO59_203 [Chloroflexi bacterium]|nr:hypothetical protein [Chloroflexota bacterium]
MLTDADPDIIQAYREQASLYREAMRILLQREAVQAAAFVALQAVRSAASYTLASLTGQVIGDEDTVAALWQALPKLRSLAVLQTGADVLARHDDLTLYAYDVSAVEAHEMADAADTFCTWALAVVPAAADIASARIQSRST